MIDARNAVAERVVATIRVVGGQGEAKGRQPQPDAGLCRLPASRVGRAWLLRGGWTSGHSATGKPGPAGAPVFSRGRYQPAVWTCSRWNSGRASRNSHTTSTNGAVSAGMPSGSSAADSAANATVLTTTASAA